MDEIMVADLEHFALFDHALGACTSFACRVGIANACGRGPGRRITGRKRLFRRFVHDIGSFWHGKLLDCWSTAFRRKEHPAKAGTPTMKRANYMPLTTSPMRQ